ncbi:MAG: hypothetical protein KGL12_14785 [Rhodospirillales bacterium]|nr:hypothetical protein [Rhodospirillales bacterium]
MVEDHARARMLAHAVPLAEAVPYGEMLTVETGHAEYWAALARRGARALREDGIPSAPLWSDYDEWPRGRVLLDRPSARLIIRADRQLHRPDRVARIAGHFGFDPASAVLMADDHYRSIRRLPDAFEDEGRESPPPARTG